MAKDNELAERQWATLREDYSATGNAWEHLVLGPQRRSLLAQTRHQAGIRADAGGRARLSGPLPVCRG